MFSMFSSLRVNSLSLIVAGVIFMFTVVNSAVTNRVFLDPYKEESVYYSSYSYDGRHGSAGRGLSYSIINNEIDGADYNVQGFDFVRLRIKLNHASSLRVKDSEIKGIKVGLVSTSAENIYHVVYVEFNQQVILESSSAMRALNENNVNDFIFVVISSIFAFFFIITIDILINSRK